MKSALSYLAVAKQCEIRELEQLTLTSELVQRTAELVHGLQKERGFTNLFLGSDDPRLAQQRQDLLARCRSVENGARNAFDRLDTEGVRIGNGARVFSRIAYVLHGLDALPGLRARIDAKAVTAAQATQAFIKLIAGLLAVVFEAADSATDPEVSRLLVAMFNFMQGKELAGQERATGAAAFASGRIEAVRQRHWLHLIDSQERCFTVFTDFADTGPMELWGLCQAVPAMAEVERLRRVACTAPADSPLDRTLGRTWFDGCTERIDAMQTVEARLAADLLLLCGRKIGQARGELTRHQALLANISAAPPAPSGFFDETAPGPQPPAIGPHLERSVLEMVQEQSHRLQAMGDELATVRAALNERKVVERAKGVLMAHRHLSEDEAHKMLRQTAMGQGRRLVDVAEAVLAMADLLPARGA